MARGANAASKSRGRWYFEISSYITKSNRKDGRGRTAERLLCNDATGVRGDIVSGDWPDVKGEA